jgi:hypothetical protein
MKNTIKKVLNTISPRLLEEPFRFLADCATLKHLHNKFKGNRCFIIGNGPSLNKHDISKLNNEYTFAVNGIFYKTEEMGFIPYFYVVEDPHVIKDNHDRISEYKPRNGGFKFLPSRFRPIFLNSKGNTYFLNFNRGFYENDSPYFEVPRFSVDASRNVYCGQSVTIVNLQLAYYLGFDVVYLIGMDFSYFVPFTTIVDGNTFESTDDDVNHFHPDYFGKGKKWHDPKLDNVLKSYRLCKLMYEFDGRKIINASFGGNLNEFERIDFDSLFI